MQGVNTPLVELKVAEDDVSRHASYGTRRLRTQLSIQFTANRDIAQKNGLHFHKLVPSFMLTSILKITYTSYFIL